MKLYVTVTSERASKGQGGNDSINIDLFGENSVMLARLIFRKNSDDAYRLTEDFFFRSERLSIHTFKEKADTPLKELDVPSKEKKAIRCEWCNKPATHKDWREIDGMTTSTRECDECSCLDTYFLLERVTKEKGKRQKGDSYYAYCTHIPRHKNPEICPDNIPW